MNKPSCLRCTKRKRECHWGPHPETCGIETEIGFCTRTADSVHPNANGTGMTFSGSSAVPLPRIDSDGMQRQWPQSTFSSSSSSSLTTSLNLLPYDIHASYTQPMRSSWQSDVVTDTEVEETALQFCDQSASLNAALVKGLQFDRATLYTTSFMNCWLTVYLGDTRWVRAFSTISPRPLLSSAIHLLGAALIDPDLVPVEYEKCIKLLTPCIAQQTNDQQGKLELRATISLLAGMELSHGTRVTFAQHLKAAVVLLQDRSLSPEPLSELDDLTRWSCVEMETVYKFLVQEKPAFTWEQLRERKSVRIKWNVQC